MNREMRKLYELSIAINFLNSFINLDKSIWKNFLIDPLPDIFPFEVFKR